MKTLKRFFQFAFALPFLIALSACGKSSTSTSTTSSGYYLSNGVCYASSSATVVATSYCTSSTGYYLSNGYCYQQSTGTIVATTYCTSSTTTTTATSGTCYGLYYYTNGYATQLVQCNGLNCRGYTLYEYYSKQPVLCQ